MKGIIIIKLIVESVDIQDRLYSEIWKHDFLAETDVQNLYKKVLNREHKQLDEDNYVKWRQNSKSEIKTALENELQNQQGSRDKQLQRLIEQYVQ